MNKLLMWINTIWLKNQKNLEATTLIDYWYNKGRKEKMTETVLFCPAFFSGNIGNQEPPNLLTKREREKNCTWPIKQGEKKFKLKLLEIMED